MRGGDVPHARELTPSSSSSSNLAQVQGIELSDAISRYIVLLVVSLATRNDDDDDDAQLFPPISEHCLLEKL